MREVAVCEGVFARVACLIRADRGAQQGDRHRRSVNVMAVFAVVQQRNAVAALAEVDPLVGADLEFCEVKRRVRMRRTADGAVGDLIRRVARFAGDVERGTENLFGFVPVDKGMEVEVFGAPFQRDFLRDAALVEGAHDAERRTDGVRLNHFDRIGFFQMPGFFHIVGF